MCIQAIHILHFAIHLEMLAKKRRDLLKQTNMRRGSMISFPPTSHFEKRQNPCSAISSRKPLPSLGFRLNEHIS